MAIYKFSVGKVELKQNDVLKKEIIPTTEISIDYDISTHKEYGPQGEVTDEVKETETLTMTISYATDTYDITLIKGENYDVFFETSDAGGGIAVTFADCKLTGYSVRTAQSAYSITTLTFSKKGAIDATPGEEITKQRVKFGATYLGDSAYVSTSYAGNVQPLIIPTALGVLIQSTSDLGGGHLTIRVNCYVKKDSRLELEQYLINLYNLLSTGKNTLTVEHGVTSYTITNCYWSGGSPGAGNRNFTDFELAFVRSGY